MARLSDVEKCVSVAGTGSTERTEPPTDMYEYCLVNTRTAPLALITKKSFRILRPEIHYRTPKESPDHPKLTKIDTFFGGGSYGAGYSMPLAIAWCGLSFSGT